MRIQNFLEHHGIAANPFADEDAQTDPVFKQHCIASTYHPTWDKIYGDPADPATAVVFGEKGSGKTAMRLQIVRQLAQYNRRHPRERVFTIEYDDFNPFLDRFRDKLSGRRQREDRALAEFKLWDHMDAILALGTTRLVDRILRGEESTRGDEGDVSPIDVETIDRFQARDLLLLASCYDQSLAETFKGRWHRLRRKLRFHAWRSKLDMALGIAVSLTVFAVIAGLEKWSWLATIWPYLLAIAGWGLWLGRAWTWYWRARGVVRNLRVVDRVANPLRQVLMNFTPNEILGQPLPNKQRTDDRYELLAKLQGILRGLGFAGIVVIVDRVDEPHLINGSADQMRALVWPMLDNKFLKHPGIGFKLLLPIELSYYLNREAPDFYQRARLDKQNMITSLEWTGEALHDVATARVRACTLPGKQPELRDLFVESITQRRLIDAFRALRVPRRLFKFLHRVLVAHCNAHTDAEPNWQVASETFETILALFQRDQEAFDRGLGAG